MSNKTLNDIGVYGWDEFEPVILGAILSQKSVLLIGKHGSNKTEGCKKISQAVFGKGTKFVPYDTSLVAADDLLGFLNSASLQKGSIDYISTPDSIWDADACLLDEINRCNPYNAAKFFEIVRARTINGRPTQLKMVFAACNPPDSYNVTHMDSAQVSRFVTIFVPSFEELSKKEQRSILNNKQLATESYEGCFKTMLDTARNCVVPAAQQSAIHNLVLKTAANLNSIDGITFSGRQALELQQLLTSMDKLSRAFDRKISEDTISVAIMGFIPEASGLVRTSISRPEIEGRVRTLIRGFKLSDPLLTATDLSALCSTSIADKQEFAASVISYIHDNVEEVAELKKAWPELMKDTKLPSDALETLQHSFIAKEAEIISRGSSTIEDVEELIKEAFKNYEFPSKAK